ncbi:exosortase family protein XrtM [Methylomonas koyamae]|uniref:exosortase family protein XrtM n=1 Tax=Methylomonas koyamae TaxID=702114 RepID=UPI001129A886|nr:exosortase family protein XrtM [Methylomonas koyamae]TPQ27009.1 exosortase family protein XrtM [Methylomonas koyamae]
MANPIELTTPAASMAAKLRRWRFPLLFAGIYGLMHRAYFQIPDEVLRDTLYHWGLVRPDAALIDLLAPGERVAAVGNHLVSARANLEVVRGCDGSGALFLVVSAMLAYPAELGRKLAGVLAAAVFMYLLNLLRIAAIYVVVAYYPAWFLPAHTYFAPTLIVVLGCLFFAWWAASGGADADGNRRVS